MLPRARQISPNGHGEVEGRGLRGWSITAAAIEASAFSDENIRHDFTRDETRIEALTTTGVRIVASWSRMRMTNDRLWCLHDLSARRRKDHAATGCGEDLVPDIGVVPTLTPLDDRETWVSDDTVRKNTTSRRSSRLFRNALYRLDEDEWIDFTSFVYERTPELANLTLRRAQAWQEDDFDLF